MEIFPAQKGLTHGFIPGDVGQQAQLDLAVIRIHQRHAGGGHKHFPDLRSKRTANRNILEVRLR